MPNTSRQDERLIRFDAFLSHNSKNKPEVRKLKQRLAAARLKAWLDEDELRPGIPWQELLEAGIRASKSVVVVVGTDGFGPWEDEEMQGALRLAVKDKRPVIPVLLPGCPAAPDLPMFLGNRTWVDLRAGFTDEGFDRLRWGITGVRPKSSGARDSDPSADAPAVEPPHEPVRPNTPEPPHAPPSLVQILPGRWQVQIRLPYSPGVMGQLNVEIFPNGSFTGQLTAPAGSLSVQGQWQADAFTNQIGFQGMQTNGFQTAPYVVVMQINYFDQQRLTGVSNVGEQVAWQRLR